MAIPTVVDASANTLTDEVDHLSVVAVLQRDDRGWWLYLPKINR